METQGKHTSENSENFGFVQEGNPGLCSVRQDRHSSRGQEAAHLRSTLADAISKAQLEIGQYLLETIFEGDVETVLAKSPRPSDFRTSSRSGMRPQRNKFIVRRPLRHRGA